MRRFSAALLAVTIVACGGRGKKDDKYKTEAATRGNVTMTVTATGTVSAVTTVQIGSQVSGVISRLYADFNSHVKKGQLLAELDPTPFQAQVEQRQADVTKSKVEAANAKITYERQRRLVTSGLAAQADLDAARAQYEAAQAQVQQSNAAMQQAQTNLHYTNIVSPIDGVVVDRQYDVGQTVAASFQAPTLFSIAQDLTKMQVQADVDQSDIGRVAVGQLARFTVDAYPDEEFRGRIAQIRLNASVNQNVVSYPVIIEVANPDEKLRPKMTANVTIDVAQVMNVLRIPNAALRFKPPEDEKSSKDKNAKGDTTATTSTGGATAGNAAPPASSTSSGNDAARQAWRMGQHNRGFGGAAGALGGGMSTQKPKRPQTIYILDANKNPKAVEIRTGISDGRYTQVVDGAVKEGDPVIVGTATSKVEGPSAFGGAGQGGPGGGGRPGAGGGGRGPR